MDRKETNGMVRAPYVPLVGPFESGLEPDIEGLRSKAKFILDSGLK